MSLDKSASRPEDPPQLGASRKTNHPHRCSPRRFLLNADNVMPLPQAAAAPLTFLPAYCFPASPTYFAWVKLTAHDIHHVLRSRTGFAAASGSKPDLLFYLNHPIQFVQVIGVLVAYDDLFEKVWGLTVDDGSGEVIECTCWKPEVEAVNGQEEMRARKIDPEQAKREAVIRSVDIGTVVQVKGTITTFRDVRQIQIERLAVVSTTNEEVVLMAARTRLLEDVLIKPWVVTPSQQKSLYRQAQGAPQKGREKVVKLSDRQKRLEQRERRHAERIAKDYNKEDAQRRKDAEATRQAGRELPVRRLPEAMSDDDHDFDELSY